MGVRDEGIDHRSLWGVRSAIDRVYDDTSVPLEESFQRMKAIRNYVEECMDTLQEEIE